MEDALTIADLKEKARRRVPKMFFDYADSGSWTEGTYRRNEADFAGSCCASGCWSTWPTATSRAR